MKREFKRVFFVVNKYSGIGFSADKEELVKHACAAHRVDFGLAYTEGRNHATTLASQAVANGFDCVVAVGGDGTVNEVARALLRGPVPMGILPKGSGNGLARHLGIPVKISNALECLFNSQEIDMDTFLLNGQLSLNVSGIGFDGYIAELFGVRENRGFEGYTRLILHEFMDFAEFDAQITEGKDLTMKKAFVIAIANSSQYGNNAKIAPAASVCDGQLNLSVLRKAPPYRLDLIYSFFSGTIDQSTYCETHAVGNVSIRLKTPMAFHVDGEPAGKADHFDVELMPSSLKVLAPSESAKF